MSRSDATATERRRPIRADVEAALLFALWHHQGGSSIVGQPIRAMLGIGWQEHLSEEQCDQARQVQGALASLTAPSANAGVTLYVDLDGVMADFDGAFPAVFGLDHRSLADDEMWTHINGHASFFRDLPPMAGAVDFFRSIEHLNPVILTACPKSNYAHVAAQKRAWVREHLSATCLVLPVMGGRHKPLFMHQPGDVLIDDWGKNCAAWTEAGGVAIKHEGDWETTRTALDSAMATTPQPQGDASPEDETEGHKCGCGLPECPATGWDDPSPRTIVGADEAIRAFWRGHNDARQTNGWRQQGRVAAGVEAVLALLAQHPAAIPQERAVIRVRRGGERGTSSEWVEYEVLGPLPPDGTLLFASPEVSEQMVERAWMVHTGRNTLGPAYADDAKCMTAEERRDMRAVLEAALTPRAHEPAPTADGGAVAEIGMSDDGYKIGFLIPLRAHRLPIGTKLYTRAAPQADVALLLEALRRIEQWQLPASGRKWDGGEPMSYGAAFGSNGERDYMRTVAREAIAAVEVHSLRKARGESHG